MDNVYILEKIYAWTGKDVEVIQTGFMEANYNLRQIRVEEIEDILTIYSENDNKISLNLNMISDVKATKDSIKMYLDNDCIIKLKAR